MNTKLATQQISLKNWALIIKDQKDSGLKVAEYCAQHNISRDAYYYWYRKVKETALKESGFVELPQPVTAPDTAPNSPIPDQFQIRYRDVQIILPTTVPKETLENLLEVLTHVK